MKPEQGVRTCRAPRLVLTLMLVGCVASTVASKRPGDLPQHVIDQAFNLGWQLTRREDRVRAEGVVEPLTQGIRKAALQLVGRDSEGEIVSFSMPAVVWWGSGMDVRVFTVELRPNGQAERFEVRVLSWEYREPGARPNR